MSDVHAFEDVLKLFEDLIAFAAKVKADGKVGIGDLAALWALLSDIKTVVTDLPDLKTEAGTATVADWQALGARAVADVVLLLKAVAG